MPRVGLFHRAISHSGVAVCALNSYPSSKTLGLILARELGCNSTSLLDTLNCLSTVEGTLLAEKQMIFKKESVDNPFGPSVEEDLGEERFYPDTPERLLEQSYGEVPYLIGINSGEGLMYIDDPVGNPDQFTNLEKEFIKYLPQKWLDEETPAVLVQVASKLKDFYIRHNSSYEEKVNSFVNFTSDRQFGYCSLKTAQFLSTRAPVYFYYFDFVGAFQRKDHAFFHLNFTVKGVCHGEELGYFFQRKIAILTQNNYTEYPRDMEIVEKMITMWTNFAAFGDPTPTENLWGVIWRPAKGGVTNHLVISDSFTAVDQSLHKARVALWDSLTDWLRAAHMSMLVLTTGEGDVYRKPLGIACLLVLILMVAMALNCPCQKKGYQAL